MRKILFVSIFILISNYSYSQLFNNKYTSKAIIITNTDTINCYLPSEDHFGKIVKYKLSKEDKNKERKSISIDEIIQIKKSIYVFDKKQYNGNQYLLKRLVNGPIKLYEYYKVTNTNTPTNNGSVSMRMEKMIYFIDKNNTLYKIKKSGKRKDLKSILTGNSEVTEMINNIDIYLFEFDLRHIVNKYNYWLTEKSN